MANGRLFEIIYYLLQKKSATAQELAARFEVSSRTILRDIEALSVAGVPVYTTQGKGGGIALMEGYVLPKAMFTQDEQQQILFALQSLPATGQLPTGAVLDKLRGLFGQADADWIEVDFSRWGHAVPDKARFAALRDVILQHRALAFAYTSASSPSGRRVVYPLRLVFKAAAWYLQAYVPDSGTYRTYKISRMQALEALPESFNRAQFQPPAVEPSGYTAPEGEPLRLRIAPGLAYRAYDEFDPRCIAVAEDGALLVTLYMPADAWLYGFLLSYGAALEVLAPQAVRAELAAQAAMIQNIYRS